MRFIDILKMSSGNLWRRKMRSLLTILGVLIGATSVIVMVSLGVGMKESLANELGGNSSMQEIVVSYDGDDIDKYITDDVLIEFEKCPYVKKINPQLTTTIVYTQGNWMGFTDLCGITQEKMAKLDVEKGRMIDPSSDGLEILVGGNLAETVFDIRTQENPYYEDGILADIDYFNRTVLFSFFDRDVIQNQNGKYVIDGRKTVAPIVGMMPANDMLDSSYGMYTDIDALKRYIKSRYHGKLIPGQPVDKRGKALKKLTYSNVFIELNSIDDVENASGYFISMGYQVSSNKEALDEINNMFKIIELVLGGIGGISLFVAAIGIANTMTMATYERTKEIGVMKVLGCDLGNIKAMFLAEAGFVGFFGGLIGLGFSAAISKIANTIAGPLLPFSSEVSISIIPMWLAVFAVIFSTLIGMIAGYLPAKRATKLSPLAAIRNE